MTDTPTIIVAVLFTLIAAACIWLAATAATTTPEGRR